MLNSPSLVVFPLFTKYATFFDVWIRRSWCGGRVATDSCWFLGVGSNHSQPLPYLGLMDHAISTKRLRENLYTLEDIYLPSVCSHGLLTQESRTSRPSKYSRKNTHIQADGPQNMVFFIFKRFNNSSWAFHISWTETSGVAVDVTRMQEANNIFPIVIGVLQPAY